MNQWVRRPVNPLAGSTARLVAHRKIAFLGLFAPLLVVIAVPILFRNDMTSVAANSTLNCYDSIGNHEPCETPVGAPQSRFNGRPTELHQLASWTTAALYQQTVWPITAVDQPANWKTSAIDQSANLTASAPAARHSAPGKRSTMCGRRLIPCFFSALRRGFTQIASVAATVGQARPAKERL
jgi:hypothetical protein